MINENYDKGLRMQNVRTLEVFGPRGVEDQRPIEGAIPPAVEIGQVVIAKKQTSICAVGDLGVCFDVIELPAPTRTNRSGKRYGVIFEGGGYNIFEGDRLDEVVTPCLFVCEDAVDYKYRSPALLERDFRYGKFDRALAALHARPEDALGPLATSKGGYEYRFWRRRFGDKLYSWGEVKAEDGRYLSLPSPYPAMQWPPEDLAIQTEIALRRDR